MRSRACARGVKAICLATLLAAGSTSCQSREPSPDPAETPVDVSMPATQSRAAPVQIEMMNVRLHLDSGVVLNIRRLRGEMVSQAHTPPVFDDPRSYVLDVFSGDLSLDMTSLTNLMNRHVFAYEGAPLKDISVEVDEGTVRQRGKLHKGVWVPFEMRATPGATRDGRLVFHTKSVSALGVPTTSLLDLFGLTVEDLMTVDKRRGVEVRGSDVIVAPGRVLPPPQIDGHLSRAEIAEGELRQVFTTADRGRNVPTLTPPDRKARNYVYFSGSTIRFGKLTMSAADLQLIDSDERDPFDFYPAKYNEQLVAGYSKNTEAKGLKTYMPDFADLEPGLDLRP